MLSPIRRWFRRLFDLGESQSAVPQCRPTRHLEVQELEDRTLPSTSPLAAVLDVPQAHAYLCGCMSCGGGSAISSGMTAGADEYRFSNGGTGLSTAYRWDQPNGRGSQFTITYSYHNTVKNGLNGITYAQLRNAVQEALGVWTKYAPIRFVEVADSGPNFLGGNDYSTNNGPMIRIGAKNIDGAYGVLGRAYYPGDGLGGDVTLDTGENWSINPGGSKIDLTEVMTHELGHTLGLNHESNKTAIMNPSYEGRYTGMPFLYSDDIAGIRALYGSGRGTVLPIGSGSTGGTASSGGATASKGPTFTIKNGVLTVNGTSGNDTFVFSSSADQITIVANGIQRNFKAPTLTQVVFAGGAGTDAVTAVGTTRSETIHLDTNSLQMSGVGPRLQATGFESIVVNAGQGNNRATLTNTLGGNTVTLGGTQAALRGNGLSWQLNSFTNVTVTGRHGGGDIAVFSGTSANDTFTARPGTATMLRGGYTFSANGFDLVQARNPNGGSDVAHLYDSNGNDTFLSANGLTTLQTSDGYTIQTYLYGPTYAYASTGYDTANLTGTTGNDTLTGNTSLTTLATSLGRVTSVGFDYVTTNGNGGNDLANLTGSLGNDTILDTPGYLSLAAGGVTIQMRGFTTVNVNGGGGTDQATVQDQSGTNTFAVRATGGTLTSPRGTRTLSGIRVINLTGTLGHDVVTILESTTTTINRSGNWI